MGPMWLSSKEAGIDFALATAESRVSGTAEERHYEVIVTSQKKGLYTTFPRQGGVPCETTRATSWKVSKPRMEVGPSEVRWEEFLCAMHAVCAGRLI